MLIFEESCILSVMEDYNQMFLSCRPTAYTKIVVVRHTQDPEKGPSARRDFGHTRTPPASGAALPASTLVSPHTVMRVVIASPPAHCDDIDPGRFWRPPNHDHRGPRTVRPLVIACLTKRQAAPRDGAGSVAPGERVRPCARVRPAPPCRDRQPGRSFARGRSVIAPWLGGRVRWRI